MKSSVAYIFVIALVGGVMSARLRRQAPPAPAGAAGPAADGPDAGSVPDAAAGGAPEGVAAPGSGVDVTGMNIALGFILNDLNDEASKGAPLDPGKVDTANKLSMIIESFDGEISDSNKQMIENLQAATTVADDAVAAPAETV